MGTAGTPTARWRLSQDVWGPARQVEEVRSGRDGATGEPLVQAVTEITCPVLAVATDERDAPEDLRAPRTARLTSAQTVTMKVLHGWRHEDVMTRGRRDDGDGPFATVVGFLETIG
jgi:hypothetical protein